MYPEFGVDDGGLTLGPVVGAVPGGVGLES